MDSEAISVEVSMSVRQQFVRMVLAATAGFIASKLVENAFDNYIYSRQAAIEIEE